jgi:hypothetical protein
MDKAEDLTDVRKRIEGNVFYPTGYIVVALDPDAEVEQAHRALLSAGFSDDDCIHVPAQTLVEEAQAELHKPHPLAILGYSMQTLERHLQLAREGCDFLLVKAPDQNAEERVRSVLSGVPIRLAVKYGHFLIEDIGVGAAAHS